MKINLPTSRLKTRSMPSPIKAGIGDIMVYHQAGCKDHPFLPYIICFLQGYLGELVRSLGTNITLDGTITVLDEHYNNVTAIHLEPGAFPTMSGWQGNSVRLGSGPLKAPPNPCNLIPGKVSTGPHC